MNLLDAVVRACCPEPIRDGTVLPIGNSGGPISRGHFIHGVQQPVSKLGNWCQKESG